MQTNLELYDNTRLSDFKKCPRFFFFRHRLHWSSTGEKRIPLVFGGAWHAGMDVIWRGVHLQTERRVLIKEAVDAFMQHWEEGGMPTEFDATLLKEYNPRTPLVATEMFYAYYDERHRQIADMELVAVERAFAVPLSPDNPSLFYIGRIDKVVRPSASRIRGIEHKTTTLSRQDNNKMPKIKGIYLEQWSPNSQVDGYHFALTMLYDKRADVWVDPALVNSKGEDFQWVPVERSRDQIDGWLWEVMDWIGAVRLEDAKLAEARPSDPYMAAFRKETSRCIDFNAVCPFMRLCKSRANPLTWGAEPPSGYEKKIWNPLDHIGTPEEIA